ncbi:MAG: fimbrillin family protein [Bacteroidales bacterium]|nr:fimbrillin family protein [Bacteroidales bacterium]
MRLDSFILSLLAGTAVLTACGKAGLQGTDVRFRVSGNTAVRAAFSGDIDGNGVERIDWEKDDRIRILSPQATTSDGGDAHWADYRIKDVREDGSSSLGNVEPAGQSVLSWGEGLHDFHAVYPSPDAVDGISLENNVFHGIIPDVQHLEWEETEGVPDRTRIYLLASAQGIEPSRNDPVRLKFRPAFTALSFTLSQEDKNPVPLRSFRLESSGGPVAGAFRMAMGEEWDVDADGTTSDVVSIGLDRTLEQGSPLTFTVLCLPLDLSGLKAVFETAYGTKTLNLSRKDGTPIVFPACHKARITGLVLPGAPDISFTVDIMPWEETQGEIEAEPSTPVND